MHLFWDLEGTIVNPTSFGEVSIGKSIFETTNVEAQREYFLEYKSLLTSLKKSNSHYIATSKPQNSAIRDINVLGFENLFQKIYGRDSFPRCESKAETLAQAIENLGISEGDCVMIGDRYNDIQAGQGNGFCTIGVLWGNGTKEELLSAGADYIAKNLKQLEEILEFLIKTESEK